MKTQLDAENTGEAKEQKPTMIGKIAGRLVPYLAMFFIGFVVIPLLTIVILREVQKIREKANRTESAKNLKQIGKAIQGYYDMYGQFPPAVVHSKEGKPLYSWR